MTLLSASHAFAVSNALRLEQRMELVAIDRIGNRVGFAPRHEISLTQHSAADECDCETDECDDTVNIIPAMDKTMLYST